MEIFKRLQKIENEKYKSLLERILSQIVSNNQFINSKIKSVQKYIDTYQRTIGNEFHAKDRPKYDSEKNCYCHRWSWIYW